jgi:hypothetical protein
MPRSSRDHRNGSIKTPVLADVQLLWQQSMRSRNFRDVGAGLKAPRYDPCLGLGLGRPATPHRPCWNGIHPRGPLTLLPFEASFYVLTSPATTLPLG